MPNFIGLTSMSISVAVHWYKSSFQFVFLGGVFCWQLNRAIAANDSQHAFRGLRGSLPSGLFPLRFLLRARERACERVCVCVTPAYTYMCVYTAVKSKD